jgi:endoglucanase
MQKRRFLSLTTLALSGLTATPGCTEEPTPLCPEGQEIVEGRCLLNLPIAVNGEGYLPARSKKAVFMGESANYRVIDVKNGDVVHSGAAEGPSIAPDTQQSVYVADFSELKAAGEYYLEANGDRSGVFRIGDDALRTTLDAAMLGLYGQRCGEHIELSFEGHDFHHQSCHLAPASMSRVDSSEHRDDSGGWHDAGDYGKYVRNGAFAVTFLLKAYEHFPNYLKDREFEIPERGGKVPDILDEARVEVEWILKAQFDDGSFAHKITAEHFEAEILPEADTQERFFFSTSTTSTADGVALLAQAARVYAEFDLEFADQCLQAALRGQAFLNDHPEAIESEQLPNGEGTGTYAWQGDEGLADRLWAFAELWETTGDEEYLIEFEARAPNFDVAHNFDWSNPTNLAVVTYLDSAREGRNEALVLGKTRELFQTTDAIADASAGDEFGRGFNSYYWGSNGVIVRMSFNLAAAHRIHQNTDYLDAMTAQIDHVLGRNGFARSYVTGLGVNPVQFPHHRPSSADAVAVPWPGLLIGGPHGEAPEGLAWEDDSENYQNNEIAINWNTALIYSLIAAEATKNDKSADCAPDCLPPTENMGGAGGMGGSGE